MATLLSAMILLLRRDGKRPIARVFGHFSCRAIVSNVSDPLAGILMLSKRPFYVLSLDIIFVPFASTVLILQRPFCDGGR